MTKDEDVKAAAQRMPHRREVPIGLRHDQRAGDVLGRMRLNDYVTEGQYQAALMLRQAVQRMHRVFDVPKHSPGAVPLDGLRRGEPREIGDQLAERWKLQHRRVYHDLIIHEGVTVAQLVTRVVVYDCGCAPIERPALRRGLNRLVSYYGGRRRAREVV